MPPRYQPTDDPDKLDDPTPGLVSPPVQQNPPADEQGDEEQPTRE